MSVWIGRNRRNLLFFPALMVLVTLYVHGCNGEVEVAGRAAAPPIDCTAGLGNYSIDCPALPNSPPQAVYANDTAQAGLFEDFAWKAFVALNWPAVIPTNATDPPNARGYPDYASHFALGQPDTLPVWGAWKEKRELFSLNASTPLPWNSEVEYFLDFPPCSNEDALAISQMRFPRLFAQAGKGLFNSLDESVQVPSEAMVPAQVAGAAVEPRLWRGSRADNNTILYEVKLGWDYYSYVDTNKLYVDTIKNQRAANSGNFSQNAPPGISFPKRGDATRYSASRCEQFNRPAANGSLPANPCPTGTIQTKSAWVLLGANDRLSDYHWTEAQYYRDLGPIPGGQRICTAYGKFGLLGFHIIQKTHDQGHYVYATWERTANDNTTFVYSNYFAGNQTAPGKGIPAGFYPSAQDSPNAITVKRMHPVFPGTSKVTAAYHDAIRAVNPNSPWLNYRLIGVQFLPVQGDSRGEPFATGSDDPTNIGQPYYLANLVIETNWGLQNFQGVPPGLPNGNTPAAFVPTQGFKTGVYANQTGQYLPNNTIAFNRSASNIGHNRRGQDPTIPGRVWNMGGCMGCHGIAQANGSDFSFVLKNGQAGAQVDTINGAPEAP